MLPRTLDQIAARIDNYVVATDESGHVLACAALEEYSPSLAEVSSVAVSPTHHGKGLGTLVVLGVERLARARSSLRAQNERRSDARQLLHVSLKHRGHPCGTPGV